METSAMLAKSPNRLIKQSGKEESAAELANVKYEDLCVREKGWGTKFNLLLVINK